MHDQEIFSLVESNFFQVPNFVYDNGDLNHYELALLQYFFRLNNSNQSFPSVQKIAKVLQCSKPTVRKSLDALIEKKYVRKTQRKRENGSFTSNLYYLLDPSKSPLPPLVNDVDHPSQGDLPRVVKEIDPHIKTYNTKTNLEKKKTKTAHQYTDDFEKFWKLYPRNKEKRKASTAFEHALLNFPMEIILKGTQLYANECESEKTELKFIKHATTFLNNECFLEFDESLQPVSEANYKKMVDGKLDQINQFFSDAGGEVDDT
ncbi:hypothetical protein HCB69_15940 [Listeria booriae]|uniref:Helix-turn-helix domain-containing protein n=1 Tax=Listeria booriae TaxID=1552123 RepID=A0A842G5L4_9LIST|nr:helix-turn-helix domain-containing protein [Listeria booriae]MBC2285867.1 hypothetical protein [Listeria booriae]